MAGKKTPNVAKKMKGMHMMPGKKMPMSDKAMKKMMKGK